MTAHHLPDPRDGDPLTVPEWDEADNMCPNCVTPWKCNGPHLFEETVAFRRWYATPRLVVTSPRTPRWPLIIAIVVVIGAVVAVSIAASRREPGPASAAPTLSGTLHATSGGHAQRDELSVSVPSTGGSVSAQARVATAPGPVTTPGSPAHLPDTATVLRGTATWCAPTPTHCQSWGGKARLGAMQSFRWGDKPYSVRVCRVGGACTTVRVVSFCACGNTLIDLSPFSFRKLAPLSRGRIHVTVERISTPGLPVLPPTSTSEEEVSR